MSVYPHPIKAVVSDNDGVLVDTLPIYIEINSNIAGEPLSKEVWSKINGRTDRDVCQILIDAYHLNTTAQELADQRLKILEQELPKCKLLPGISDLITKLKQLGLPMAVATSSRRAAFDPKTRNHQDLFKNFSAVVCGDEVAKAKPAPDIFLAAAAKLGDYKPENVLVLEDAANGIKAANDAGMASVLIWRHKDTDPQAELDRLGAKPTFIIHSAEEFDFNAFTFEGKQ